MLHSFFKFQHFSSWLNKFFIDSLDKLSDHINDNFFRINDLDTSWFNLRDITILIFCIDYHILIIPRKRVFVLVGTLPGLSCCNAFVFVIDIINWSLLGFTFNKIEASNHSSLTEWVIVDILEFVFSFKLEFSFSEEFVVFFIDE